MLGVGPDGQSLGRSRHDHFRTRCLAVDGINILDAVFFYHCWRDPMRNSVNSMTLGAAFAK
jgi:hypothetical protein